MQTPRFARAVAVSALLLTLAPGLLQAGASPSTTFNASTNTYTRFDDFSGRSSGGDYGTTLGVWDGNSGVISSATLLYSANSGSAANNLFSNADWSGASLYDFCDRGGGAEFTLKVNSNGVTTNGQVFFGVSDAGLVHVSQTDFGFAGLMLQWDGTAWDFYAAGTTHAGTASSNALVAFQNVAAGSTVYTVSVVMADASGLTCGAVAVGVTTSTTADAGSAIGAGSLTTPVSHWGATTSAGAGSARSGGSFTIDDVSVTAAAISAASASTATVAVTALVGFDVDPSGATAIARTDGGATVRTYAAGSLTGSQSDPTNCNRVQGVAAYETHVSYFQCDAGDSSNVVSLSVRSSSLGSPDTPDICTGSGFCIENIDDEELSGSQDAQIDLVTLQEFPFDYGVGCATQDEDDCNRAARDEFGPYDQVNMAWGVTSTDGRAGVLTYTMNDNLDDTSRLDTILVDPSASVPDQICIAYDLEQEKSFMYAASDASNVKGVRVDFQRVTGSALDPGYLDVDLVPTFSGSASTAAPAGIGCGNDVFAILNTNKLTLWRHGESTPFCTKTGLTSVQTRGVVVSANGLYTAYTSGGSWNALNNEDCVVTGSGTLPTGTFKEIKMQGNGSTLWVATSTTIAVYANFFQVTSGEDTVYTPPGVTFNPGSGGPGGSGGGLLPPPTDEQIAIFGSERAVQGFQGMVMLVTGAGLGGAGIFQYSRETKQKVSAKVLVAVCVGCGLLATVSGWFFGIVQDWFLGLVIAIMVFILVGAGVAKFAGNDK